MSLIISSPPHLKSRLSTSYLMKQVMIALLPAVIASIYFFGIRAVLLIANCTFTALITERIILLLRKKPSTLNDYSAAVTGLLLALTLPPSVTWYAASLGSIVAISIGKHIFGGLGANIFNPALIGRAFLMAAYPKMLTTFIKPNSVDAISSATPLILRKFSQVITPNSSLFFGKVSGSLGETSAICLIIGGLYLLIRKVAGWRIPLSLLLTTTISSIILYLINPSWGSIWFHLFSGGLLLGAFFMATDPVTTPTTKKGRYIFGIGCGILIMIIRYFGGLPEGVMYSILFMNALTPLINRYTKPRRFGT
ncbi:MAG: RnfABCDGE type electron transport complex subunit D [Candidatus Susulua stagnicola]|nr:RnfABCDGE type electron transport complex subunit D [Candidatus Susulua stagnicola]